MILETHVVIFNQNENVYWPREVGKTITVISVGSHHYNFQNKFTLAYNELIVA